MKNDEPDALDRLMDGALASYSTEEPLAGLEQRVMTRVRAEGAAARTGIWRWAAAVAAVAAAVLILTVMLWRRPAPPPRIAERTAPKQVQVATSTDPVKPAPRTVRRKRQAQSKPAPLSTEERALMALAALTPELQRAALIDLQKTKTEPIQITEIRIEPITIEPLRRDDAK